MEDGVNNQILDSDCSLICKIATDSDKLRLAVPTYMAPNLNGSMLKRSNIAKN